MPNLKTLIDGFWEHTSIPENLHAGVSQEMHQGILNWMKFYQLVVLEMNSLYPMRDSPRMRPYFKLVDKNPAIDKLLHDITKEQLQGILDEANIPENHTPYFDGGTHLDIPGMCVHRIISYLFDVIEDHIDIEQCQCVYRAVAKSGSPTMQEFTQDLVTLAKREMIRKYAKKLNLVLIPTSQWLPHASLRLSISPSRQASVQFYIHDCVHNESLIPVLMFYLNATHDHILKYKEWYFSGSLDQRLAEYQDLRSALSVGYKGPEENPCFYRQEPKFSSKFEVRARDLRYFSKELKGTPEEIDAYFNKIDVIRETDPKPTNVIWVGR